MPTEAVVAGFADAEDPSVLAKQLKKELKDFERAFQQREGRKPDKADIAQNKDISRKYKQYSKLKSQLGNDAGDEDTATRKAAATPPVSKQVESVATAESPALARKSSSDSLPRRSKPGSADKKKSKRASESRQGEDSDVPPAVPRKQSDASKQKTPLVKKESMTETELEPVTPNDYVKSGPLNRTALSDGLSSTSASPVAWNYSEELPANFKLPKNQNDRSSNNESPSQRAKLEKNISVSTVESTDLNHLLKETVADMEHQERSPGSAFSNFLARKNQIESLSSSRPETPVSAITQSPVTPVSDQIKPTIIDSSAARRIEVATKAKDPEPALEEIPIVVEAPAEETVEVEQTSTKTPPSAEKDEVERPMTSNSSDASDDNKARPSSGTTFGSSVNEPPPLPPKTGIDADSDEDKENESGAVMPVTDKDKGDLSVDRPRSVSRSHHTSDRDLTPLLQPKLFSRVPKGHILKCKVYRKKTILDKTHPVFFVYNESDDNFLMAAKKRMMTKAVSFVISNNADELGKDSQYYIGKLSANSQRTQFILSDARQYNKLAAGKGLKQLLCVQYSKTVLPREMQAAIPATTIGEESDEISKDIVEDMRIRNTEKLMLLRNKPPRWNEATQTHCLNFGGRVTMPSIKNFQLVGEQDENYITMQFGRCGDNEFTMDVKWPMTPIQAFSIALTTFDAYDSA